MSLSRENVDLDDRVALLQTAFGSSPAGCGSDELLGTVRFIGPVNFAEGEWVGVELDDARGKNDGSMKGTRYFECKPGYGVIVRPSAVRKVSNNGPCHPKSRVGLLRRQTTGEQGGGGAPSPQSLTPLAKTTQESTPVADVLNQKLVKHVREVSLLLHNVCLKVEHLEDRLENIEKLAERVEWGEVDEDGNLEPSQKPSTPTKPSRFQIGDLLALEVSGGEQEDATSATRAAVGVNAATTQSASPNQEVRSRKSHARGRGRGGRTAAALAVDNAMRVNSGQVSPTRSQRGHGFGSGTSPVREKGTPVQNSGTSVAHSASALVVVPPEMVGMSLDEKLEVYKKQRQSRAPVLSKVQEMGSRIEAEKFVKEREVIHRLRRCMHNEVTRRSREKHVNLESDADTNKRNMVLEMRRKLLSEIEDKGEERAEEIRRRKEMQIQKARETFKRGLTVKEKLTTSLSDHQDSSESKDTLSPMKNMEMRFQRELREAMKAMERRFQDSLAAVIEQIRTVFPSVVEKATSSLQASDLSAAKAKVKGKHEGKQPTPTGAEASVDEVSSDILEAENTHAMVATVLSSVQEAALARQTQRNSTMMALQALEDAETERRQELFLGEQWEEEKKRRTFGETQKVVVDLRARLRNETNLAKRKHLESEIQGVITRLTESSSELVHLAYMPSMMDELEMKASKRKADVKEKKERMASMIRVFAEAAKAVESRKSRQGQEQLQRRLSELDEAEQKKLHDAMELQREREEEQKRQSIRARRSVLNSIVETRLNSSESLDAEEEEGIKASALQRQLLSNIEEKSLERQKHHAEKEKTNERKSSILLDITEKAKAWHEDQVAKEDTKVNKAIVLSDVSNAVSSRKSRDEEKMKAALAELDLAEWNRLRELITCLHWAEEEERRSQIRKRRSLLCEIETKIVDRDEAEPEIEKKIVQRVLLNEIEEKAQALEKEQAKKADTVKRKSSVLAEVIGKANQMQEQNMAKNETKKRTSSLLTDLMAKVKVRDQEQREKKETDEARRSVVAALQGNSNSKGDEESRLRKLQALEEAHERRLQELVRTQHEMEERERQETVRVRRSVLNEIEATVRSESDSPSPEVEERLAQNARRRSLLSEVETKGLAREREQVEKARTVKRASSVLSGIVEARKAMDEKLAAKDETRVKRSAVLSEVRAKVVARRDSIDEDKLIQILQDMEHLREKKVEALAHEAEIDERRMSARTKRSTLNSIDSARLSQSDGLDVEELERLSSMMLKRSLLSDVEETALALQRDRVSRDSTRRVFSASVLSLVVEKSQALDEDRREKEHTKSRASCVMVEVQKAAKERDEVQKVKELTKARALLSLLELVETANDRQGQSKLNKLKCKLQELEDADLNRLKQVVETQTQLEEEERRKAVRTRRSVLNEIELKVRSKSEGGDPENDVLTNSKIARRSLLSDIEEKVDAMDKDRVAKEQTKKRNSELLVGVVSAAKAWEEEQSAKEETRQKKAMLLSALVEKAGSLQESRDEDTMKVLLNKLDDADWQRVVDLALVQFEEEEAARRNTIRLRRSLLNDIELKGGGATTCFDEDDERGRKLNPGRRSLLNEIEEKAFEWEEMKASREKMKARKSSVLSAVMCAVKERDEEEKRKQEVQKRKSAVFLEMTEKVQARGDEQKEKKETMERKSRVLSSVLARSASMRTKQEEDRLKLRLEELDEADRKRIHEILREQHEHEERQRRKVLQTRRSLLNDIDLRLRTKSDGDDAEHHDRTSLNAQRRTLLNDIEEKAHARETEHAQREQTRARKSSVLSDVVSAVKAREAEQTAKEETKKRKSSLLSDVLEKANASREARNEKMRDILQELDDAHLKRMQHLLHLEEEDAELRRRETLRSRRRMLNQIELRGRSQSDGDLENARRSNSKAARRSLLTDIEEKALSREQEQAFKEQIKTRKSSLLLEVTEKAKAREVEQDRKGETRALHQLMLSGIQDQVKAMDSFAREKRETKEQYSQVMHVFRMKSGSLRTERDEDKLKLKLQELHHSEQKRLHNALMAEHEHEVSERKELIRARRSFLNDIDLKQRSKTELHDVDDHEQAKARTQRRSLMTDIEEAAHAFENQQVAKDGTKARKSAVLSEVEVAAKVREEERSAKEETKARMSSVTSELVDMAISVQGTRDKDRFTAWMKELDDASWRRLLLMLQVQNDEEEKQRMRARRSMRRLLNEIEQGAQSKSDLDDQEDTDRAKSLKAKRFLLSDIEEKALAREKEHAFKEQTKVRKSSLLADVVEQAKLREENAKKKEETRERKSLIQLGLKDSLNAMEEGRREKKETIEKRKLLNKSFLARVASLRTRENEEGMKLRLQELDELDQKRVHDVLKAHNEHEEQERQKILRARRALLNHIDLKLGSKSDIEEEDRQQIQSRTQTRRLLTDIEEKAQERSKEQAAKEHTKVRKSSVLSDISSAAKAVAEARIGKEDTKRRNSSLLSEFVENTKFSQETRDEDKLKTLLQELDDQHAKRLQALWHQQQEEEQVQRRLTIRSKRRMMDELEGKGRSFSDGEDIEDKAKPVKRRSLLSDIEEKALRRQKELEFAEAVRVRKSRLLPSVVEKAKAIEDGQLKKMDVRERKSLLLSNLLDNVTKKEEHYREKKETIEKKSSVLSAIITRGTLMQLDPNEALINKLKVEEKMKEHDEADRRRLEEHVKTQQELEEEERKKTIQLRRSVLSEVEEQRKSNDDFDDSSDEQRVMLNAKRRSLATEIEVMARRREREQVEKEKTKEQRSNLLSTLGNAMKAREEVAIAKEATKARMSGMLSQIVAAVTAKGKLSEEAVNLRLRQLEDINQHRLTGFVEAQLEQAHDKRRKTIQVRRSVLNSIASRARAASDPELEAKVKADTMRRTLLNEVEKAAEGRRIVQLHRQETRRRQAFVLKEIGDAVMLRTEAAEYMALVKAKKSTVLAAISGRLADEGTSFHPVCRFRVAAVETDLREKQKKAQTEASELMASIRVSIDRIEQSKAKAHHLVTASTIRLQRSFRARAAMRRQKQERPRYRGLRLFRIAVRKVMAIRIMCLQFNKRGLGASAHGIVGTLEANLAIDDEFEAVMAKWESKGARKTCLSKLPEDCPLDMSLRADPGADEAVPVPILTITPPNETRRVTIFPPPVAADSIALAAPLPSASEDHASMASSARTTSC